MAQWSKETFARNLKKYMNMAGKNQKDMSEIVGVSTATFSDWINAKKFPRIDKIEIMADYFGILKSDLIEDKEISERTEKAEAASDIIIRLGADQKFCDAVKLLYRLDEEKLEGVTAMLRSLVK